MKAQIVILKSGDRIVVPMPNNYSKLELMNTQGTLVWQHDMFVFPHENVQCIIEVEVPEVVKPGVEKKAEVEF